MAERERGSDFASDLRPPFDRSFRESPSRVLRPRVESGEQSEKRAAELSLKGEREAPARRRERQKSS